MKITSSSWQKSSDTNFIATDDEYSVSLVKVGFAGLIFGILIYSSVLFAVVKILRWQEIISWDIEWGASLLLGLIFVVIRGIDKAMFRQPD